MPTALTRMSADGLLEPVLGAFDADGCVIVEGMVGSDLIEELLRATMAFAQGVEPGVADQGMGEEENLSGPIGLGRL